LCNETIRRTLRIAIDNVRTTRPFSIDARVLLPDHLHCIWTLPDGDHDFSTRWSLIKRPVPRFSTDMTLAPDARTASACKRRESTIWQRRFWEHQIRDELDFERHFDHVHFNPVKHGHAARVMDWPYSTFHRCVRDGVYAADWGQGNRNR